MNRIKLTRRELFKAMAGGTTALASGVLTNKAVSTRAYRNNFVTGKATGGSSSGVDLSKVCGPDGSGGIGGSGGGTGGAQPSVDEWTPITITGGSNSNYILQADQLRKKSGRGKVFGSTAVGSIKGGKHVYEYKGRLLDFRAQENIQVSINGEKKSKAQVQSLLCGSGTAAASAVGGSSSGAGTSAAEYLGVEIPESFDKTVKGKKVTDDTIRAVEDSFRISNVAVINNKPSPGHGGGRAIYPSVTDPDGVGIIENCYLEGGKQNNGMYVHHKHHRGTLILRNCYITRWGGDALYAETAKPRGLGGKIIVDNCYFLDNNVSHVRISKGLVRDTVIHNTNNVPSNFSGQVNSRGLNNMYAGNATVEVENVDVDVGPHNTNGSAAAINIVDTGIGSDVTPSNWNIKNSELKGPRRDRGHASYENVGKNPDIHVPEGVPQSPDEAL